MDAWTDWTDAFEADDLPSPDELAALLSAADRVAAGPSWFARALAASRPGWQRDGLCNEHPEVSWFPAKGQPTGPAKAICRRCLVCDECLTFAVDGLEVGVWGASSDRERQAIRVARHEPGAAA